MLAESVTRDQCLLPHIAKRARGAHWLHAQHDRADHVHQGLLDSPHHSAGCRRAAGGRCRPVVRSVRHLRYAFLRLLWFSRFSSRCCRCCSRAADRASRPSSCRRHCRWPGRRGALVDHRRDSAGRRLRYEEFPGFLAPRGRHLGRPDPRAADSREAVPARDAAASHVRPFDGAARGLRRLQRCESVARAAYRRRPGLHGNARRGLLRRPQRRAPGPVARTCACWASCPIWRHS